MKLLVVVLLALAPLARPQTPPPVTRPRPPIPTFTPTPTPTPTRTAVPPTATPVPTPRLSTIARDRALRTDPPPAPRFAFQKLTLTRTTGAVSVDGWLTNSGGLPACAITFRVSVVDANGRHVGSAEGSPRSPDLAAGHGSSFELSVPIPETLDADPGFQIGSASAAVVSYSNACRE